MFLFVVVSRREQRCGVAACLEAGRLSVCYCDVSYISIVLCVETIRSLYASCGGVRTGLSGGANADNDGYD